MFYSKADKCVMNPIFNTQPQTSIKKSSFKAQLNIITSSFYTNLPTLFTSNINSERCLNY